MDGIVGRVEIENNALRRRRVALEKEADEQPFHRALVHAELAIAVVVCLWRMFKPVQRRLSRQHSAIGAARFSLARDKAQHGIMAQFIVIVEVFIAKRDAMNALGEQRFDRVLARSAAAICEAGRDLPGQAEDAVGLAQQQRTCVRGDGPAVKSRCDFPASEAGEIQGILATLCLHRGCPLL